MAVLRVKKPKDDTIIFSHHLKERRLSLKAKGVLLRILFLPGEWDEKQEGRGPCPRGNA